MTVEQLIKLLQEAKQTAEVRIGGKSRKAIGKRIGGVWHGSCYIEILPE